MPKAFPVNCDSSRQKQTGPNYWLSRCAFGATGDWQFSLRESAGMVIPGQVITAETIEFMRKLDVKEIHGYTAVLGLELLNPSFLQSRKSLGDSARQNANRMRRIPAA